MRCHRHRLPQQRPRAGRTCPRRRPRRSAMVKSKKDHVKTILEAVPAKPCHPAPFQCSEWAAARHIPHITDGPVPVNFVCQSHRQPAQGAHNGAQPARAYFSQLQVHINGVTVEAEQSRPADHSRHFEGETSGTVRDSESRSCRYIREQQPSSDRPLDQDVIAVS